jgi:thymidylate synthase
MTEEVFCPIDYRPASERTPDTQYHDFLEAIMKRGKDKKPIHATLPENAGKPHSFARELTGKACCLEFDLSNGFPIFPERDTRKLVTGAIGEIAAFLNGARTLEELASYGCPRPFWEKWVTEDKCKIFGLEAGDLGGGSYGPALRAFPTGSQDGATFDQLAALHETMRTFPMGRTIMMMTWIPQLALGSKEQGFDRKVVVAPCHGTVFHVHIFPELGEMEVTCLQRSADAPVGLMFNVAQWCTLGLILSMIHKLKFTKYTHFVSSAQIYDMQFESVERLLATEPRILPTVALNPEKPYENPWDLRREQFVIGEDYDPHPNFVIPTPI